MAISSMELELYNDGTEVMLPSLTWFLNREAKSLGGEIDGLEAVRQAVELQIDTMRFGYELLDAAYGSEMESLVGRPYEYIKAELPRIVEDACLRDDRVSGVLVYDIQRTALSTVAYAAAVTCVFGDFTVMGVTTQLWQ